MATTGGVVRNYVYLNGLPLAVIGNAGAVNYVLNDHIGQLQKIANASGASMSELGQDGLTNC